MELERQKAMNAESVYNFFTKFETAVNEYDI